MILRGAGRSLVVLNLALPPQRHKPASQPEHQDLANHMAQKIREREKKERKKVKESKIKLLKIF